MRNKKGAISKKLFTMLSGLITVAFVILIAVFMPDAEDSDNNDIGISYTDYPLCVTFFDVGQGDGALISCDGYNILVDGGVMT